jgi:glycine/sarcosine N-methyltransferase
VAVWKAADVVDPAAFYDGLAQSYEVLFDDWRAAAEWHGSVVASLLEVEGVGPPSRVLDCTCGIGTQALPLARLGYEVTGTDLSAGAVERARAEAAAWGVAVALEVADVCVLGAVVAGSFDAVISCDNALPHLLTDADLDAALRSIRLRLEPDGLVLASIRDYDQLVATRPDGVPVALYGEPGSRHGAGQAWSWCRGRRGATPWTSPC